MASAAFFLIFFAVLSWSGTTAWAQSDASFWTSWVPLAVRSPYLSTWMNTTNIPFNSSNVDGVLRAPTLWPQFLQGPTNGWAGMIRIDQTQTFKWLSDPLPGTGINRTILTNMQVTPTRTIMNMTAGPLDLRVTFLSPIEPADPVLQSLPFSYVALEATSNDGQQHDVQVYLDTSGEWLSGNRSQVMNWVNQPTDEILYSQFDLVDPQPLTEVNNQADDATLFYAMPLMPSQTLMINFDRICRPQFRQHGVLTNQAMSGPLPIQSGSGFPVSAMSVDLGTISATQKPIVWAVGLNRDPAIGYVSGDGTSQQRSPYWVSEFGTIQDAMTFFVTGYQDALTRAIALDNRITTAASSVSTHYADLVSLAARQAMGGTELTIAPSSSDPSRWNTSDVMMFMKDVGTSGRVNPVEGLYASLPFFLYLNATYVGWLLDPLLDFASSSRWSFPYAPKDLGNNYPNAAGDSSSHNQGIEQSGNLLIMSLAHARATGDGSLLTRYYAALQTWAEYLLNETLPLDPSQVSADTTDTQGSLANLALKGIIGVKAMSAISAALGLRNDADRYSDAAASLAAEWQAQAVSSDGQYLLTDLGEVGSSLALTYNLFADKLLETDVVPAQLYASQTQALNASISTTSNGLPIDAHLSRQANTVWSMFASAYTNDTGVQRSIIDQTWSRVSDNTTDTGIFATSYQLHGTGASINTASPFIGGVLAPLSLNVPSVAITHIPKTNPAAAPSPTATPNHHNNVRAIVGGVIGGVGAAALLLLAALLCWRQRYPRRLFPTSDGAQSPTKPVPFPYTTTPDDPALEAAATDQISSRRPLQILSAKAREANARMFRRRAPSVSVSVSTYSSSSADVYSSNPPTEPAGPPSSAHGPSRSDVRGLRAEMRDLRRAIRSLGAPRPELPPVYGSPESQLVP